MEDKHMNPNETLKRLREVLAGDSRKCNEWDSERTPYYLETVCEAEELFQALDKHLSAGGSIPKDWIGPTKNWEIGR